jgi:hypothetical protein
MLLLSLAVLCLLSWLRFVCKSYYLLLAVLSQPYFLCCWRRFLFSLLFSWLLLFCLHCLILVVLSFFLPHPSIFSFLSYVPRVFHWCCFSCLFLPFFTSRPTVFMSCLGYAFIVFFYILPLSQLSCPSRLVPTI